MSCTIRLSLISAITLIASVVTNSASANVTYTYTGLAFNSLNNDNPNAPTFTTSEYVTAAFETAAYLPANQMIVTYFQQNTYPIAWSMYAGPVTNSSANGDDLVTLAIATDASGNIIYWDMFSSSQPYTTNTQYTTNIRTFQYSDAFLGYYGTGNVTGDATGVYPTNSDYSAYPVNGGYATAPGTWVATQTDVQIPEPGSLILFVSGVALIALRRTAKATSQHRNV